MLVKIPIPMLLLKEDPEQELYCYILSGQTQLHLQILKTEEDSLQGVSRSRQVLIFQKVVHFCEMF